MQTTLAPFLAHTPQGQEAEQILRACVHCGFCSATCPTYQLLGDELDSPRGRIYLLKQVLEGQPTGESTHLHLDRCLGCRACESTCPSGVRYHRLKEIGQAVLAQQQPLSRWQQMKAYGLRKCLLSPLLLKGILRLAGSLKIFLPKHLSGKIPALNRAAVQYESLPHAQRQVILPGGCVQAATQPQTHQATQKILAHLGIGVFKPPQDSCCGALSYHAGAQAEGLALMRRNIDHWWPAIQAGKIDAIISTASGCGLMIKEYAEYLKHEPEYAEKAAQVSALTQDVGEFLAKEDLQVLSCIPTHNPIAFHPPCTLQHGQKVDVIPGLLEQLGFQLTAIADSHLCCGSAGTYSLFQPLLSQQLLENKLKHIYVGQPTCIVSANIGCQLHLDSQSHIPVKHWVELLAESLAPT